MTCKLRKCVFPVFATTCLLRATHVPATYSIVGADSGTGQIGGAAASCVEIDLFPSVYSAVPGKGVLHAQALITGNESPRELGIELLKNETEPIEIVRTITKESADPLCCLLEVPHRFLRQYGVVDLQGRNAGFTGPQIQDLYNILGYGDTDQRDMQGNVEKFTYSVQGNVVTSNVIFNAETAFISDGCDLADRLMLALGAGRRNGEGDSRCTQDGISSSSSFIHVDNSDGSVFLHLAVVNTTVPNDAVVKLQEGYKAWREENPCPNFVGPNSFPNTSTLPLAESASSDAFRMGYVLPLFSLLLYCCR